MNPGSPTPQAGILNHSSPQYTRIHHCGKLDDDPRTQKYALPIINTLRKAEKEGKKPNTVNSISHTLRQLSKEADLNNPGEVQTYISTATNKKTKKPLTESTKTKLCFGYEWYCKTNGIQWTKPKYKWEEGIPIIPTTDNVTKIISASSRKYATIFTILAETAVEGEELHNVSQHDIDKERGIIGIKGTKGHASGNYKLKTTTAEMLREYLTKNTQEYPFPKPKAMAEMWRRFRNRLADNLKQPELKKIPMKSLRNYSGAKLYYALKDPIAVMRHMRHKKLETTMHYLRAIVLDGEEEYI